MGDSLKVACLYRVSSKQQVDGNDIPMQKTACRAFIEKMDGWILGKEYAEKGVSGYHKSAEQRDVLQQIKADAEKRVFDILLVFMFDRLGRREDETPFIVEWFVSHGIEVWSVKEGQQKFENRADKLINYIRYWQSGGESEKTSMRVKEKHKQMVEEGLFRGGTAPYGYKLISSERTNKKGYSLKALAVDEYESKIVKDIFELVVDKGYGGHRIAKYLNERNIRTRRGNFWTNDTVMTLLKNPIYKGYYVSGKRITKRGCRTRTHPDNWIYSKEQIPAYIIIDEDTWNLAADIRSSRNHNDDRYPRSTKGTLLLTGLAKCGGCGTNLVSRYEVKKWTTKDGKEHRAYQARYICQGRNAKILCDGQKSYAQGKIEPLVLHEIHKYLGSLNKIDLSWRVEEVRENHIKDNKNILINIRSSIQKLSGEIEVLNNEIVYCLMGKSSFTKDQLGAVITQKQAEMESLAQEESNVVNIIDSNERDKPVQLQALIPNWITEFGNAELPVKKMLLQKFINCVYISMDHVEIDFKYDLFNLR